MTILQPNKPDGPGWWYLQPLKKNEVTGQYRLWRDYRIVELTVAKDGRLRGYDVSGYFYADGEPHGYWQRVPPPSWIEVK